MRRVVVFATAEAAEEAFYDAMQRGDVAGMMALWADEEDAVCVHPSGQRLVGLPAIRAAFEEIFAGGGVDVRPAEVRVYQGAVIAVHNLVEKVLVAGKMSSQVVECVADQLLALRDTIGDFGTLLYAGMDWKDRDLARRSMVLLAEKVRPLVEAGAASGALGNAR